jgi:hypothetical protein
MSVENLTRFLPACSIDEVPTPIMIQTLDEDSYVRFLDVKEASSNSLQQLKAEILPAFADGMEYLLRGDCENALEFFNKVSAKLTAV